MPDYLRWIGGTDIAIRAAGGSEVAMGRLQWGRNAEPGRFDDAA